MLLTIIDIVKRKMRILGVVNHQWTSQTVAILSSKMRVVPKRARLARTREIICKGMIGNDRALVNECAWQGCLVKKIVYTEWTINLPPSISLVPFWKNPCQC